MRATIDHAGRRCSRRQSVALGFAVLALGGCGAEPDDEQRARSAVEALYLLVIGTGLIMYSVIGAMGH